MLRHFGTTTFIFCLTPLCLQAQDVLVNTRLQQFDIIENDNPMVMDLKQFFQTYPSPGPIATVKFSMPQVAGKKDLKVGINLDDFGGWKYVDGQLDLDLSETSPTVSFPTFERISGEPYEHFFQIDEVTSETFVFTDHEIQFELLPEKAPITVANFMTYQSKGAYENTIINSNQYTGEVVLRNDGLTSFSNPKTIEAGRLQLHTPTGESDTVLFDYTPVDTAIMFEQTDFNTIGTLSMFRGSSVNSATSRFRINLADNSNLLGNFYAVFGRLVSEETDLPILQDFATTPVFNLNHVFGSGVLNFASIYAHDYRNPNNFPVIQSIEVSAGDPSGITHAWSYKILDEDATDTDLANREAVNVSIDSASGVLTATKTPGKTGQFEITVTASKSGLEDASFNIFLVAYNEAALNAFPSSAIATGTWLLTSWYGWISADTYPNVFHPNHGWQYFAPSNVTPQFYIYDQDLGWFYTTTSLYPNLYVFRTDEWVYYVLGTGDAGAERAFYRGSEIILETDF